ncbi:MAG: glycosyltransferase family 4 protein [Pseudomonadota bacterium]
MTSYLFVAHDALGWRSYSRSIGAAFSDQGAQPTPIIRIGVDRWRRARYRWARLSSRWGAFPDHVAINAAAVGRALASARAQHPADHVHFADHAMAGPAEGLDASYSIALDVTGALRRRTPGFNQVSSGAIEREARLFKGAAALFPMSEWTAASLRDDYAVDERRILTIEPSPRDVAPGEPHPALDAFRPTKRLLFVGGDFERKGGPELLEAARQLGDGVGLVIAGPPAERFAGTPGVLALGPVDNDALRRRVMPFCHLLALPSRKDMTPWVLAEANAAGLPSIVSNLAALPGLTDYAEGTNVIVSVEPSAIAATAERLLRDETRRRHLGEAARARFERFQNADKNAQRMRAFIEERRGESL